MSGLRADMEVGTSRWAMDLLVIGAVVALFLLGLRLVFVPVSGLERRVWARVLHVDRLNYGHVVVDYFYEGEKYEKSVDGRSRLRPGETVTLHFFGWNPSKADWRSHGGGHGPYTLGGVLACLVVWAFVLPLLVVALWRTYFRGRKPLPWVTLSKTLGRSRWVSEYWVAVLIGLVIAIGMLSILCTVTELDRPDRLAEVFLSAMADGHIEDACDLVAAEKRYDFLSNVKRWELMDFEVRGRPIQVGGTWEVRYWHKGRLDGEPMEGIAVLGTAWGPRWVPNSGCWAGFRVVSGYLPGRPSPGAGQD